MTDHEGAIALYTFLKEFVQLRTRTVRDVSQYEQVIWAVDVPREPGCDSIAWHREEPEAPDEVWLEIRKPRLTRPPEPPELARDWVRPGQLDDSSLDLPELYETILGESPENPPLRREDHPEVEAAWDTYIADRWWHWAEQDRREQAVQGVYTELFSMFQRQQRLGENFEIVFGFGYLSWNSPDGQTVGRHLAVARVSVAFDTTSGTLTVTPAGEGARPSLEQDMLDPQYRPDPELLSSIEETLDGIGDSLWAAGPIDGLLKSWVHSVSPEGEYSDELERVASAGDNPIVHFAPALILRRRSERSFLRAFEDIITQLEAGEPVPEGVSRFISVSGDQDRDSLVHQGGNGARAGETFFPLPANDAQQRIVERLVENQGVLVQGPPGTGKSHTIVNLICHSLAKGERVLVTSHAVRALKVLQRMIRERVPDLAPLSVVLLGDDREALAAMEESVQGITTRQNTWDPETSSKAIARLELGLDQARRRQARIFADLRAIRERETLTFDARFGYTGTLALIAQTLRGERESLSWIGDVIPEELDPPLTVAEFSELVALLRNESLSDWEASGRVGIDLKHLPDTESFEQAVQGESEAQETYNESASIRQRPEYGALEVMPPEERSELRHGLSELIQLIERIHRRPLPWVSTATRQILGDYERSWRQLHEDTSRVVESTVELAGWLDENPITPEPDFDLQKLRGDAAELLEHLEGGGGWGIGPFRSAVVKRALYIRRLRIGGRLCETAETINDLVRRLHAELEFRHLRERWAPNQELTAATFTDGVAELADLCEPLEEAFEALRMSAELSRTLARVPGGPEPDWSDLAALRGLRETLAAVDATERYESARSKIQQALEELRAQQRAGRLDPTSEGLRAAISERSTTAYTEARQRAAANVALERQLKRRRTLHERLAGGAPELAGVLAEAPADPVWDGRAGDFDRAWNWSRAQAWVIRMAAPDAEQQHRLELENAKQTIARVVEQLAAEKAWAHCFERMTEHERQHLVAWSKAVRSIAGGFGKYAPMHRRSAKEHLDESRSAIPAWVMPLHRVAETIRPGSELFDIAIIDEASQSGPEALLLAYLAKKLVVVGDDKQIHPTYAGVNFEDVNQLRERYISDLPHADAYGVNQSFFDLAEIRYRGRIRLREHFRCMPEIIQFSNNLWYQGEPLIPLRQYGAGRLEPTIDVRPVADGYLRGSGRRNVNPPEAEAIVEEITRLCADDAYRGKTMGVISLVGDAQAREIETQLLRALGPEEIERRQLVCGDAYAFQGDERDVIFLSMVSAPRENRRIPAMTDAAAQRRFNVAASRARDQLYLFHTATLADLNPSCLRYQLLEYCLNPSVKVSDVAGLDVADLEQLAFRADRQRVSPPTPFDSWFEVDVFLRIARRGYRVIPQFEVGGYRIDLVVQGMDGSLAVECDGDAWHGPDRYEDDAARQRDLERCGWVFWRIRGSAFHLNPDEALEDLWEMLKRRRILPAAETDAGRDVPGEVKVEAEPVPAVPVGKPDGIEIAAESGRPEQATGADEREVTAASGPTQVKVIDAGEIAAEPDRTSRVRKADEATPSVEELASPDVSPRIEDAALLQPALGWSPLEAAAENADGIRTLAPYETWSPAEAIPDPRTASQTRLAELLTEVVAREGPVIAIRAYRLLNRASGSQRLTMPARRAFNRACAAAERSGLIEATNPLRKDGQAQRVLRVPGDSEVVLRERGPRALDELPPDEVAMMLRELRQADPTLDSESLKRRALERLGWVRLTRNASTFLDECVSLA